MHWATFLHRFAVLTLLAALSGAAGCASMPEPAPGIAETDETLSRPMRPAVKREVKWWDFENLLDPRSREIDSHFGF